eukprot:scaffold193826_cov31-Attheya_sp.AAC.1
MFTWHCHFSVRKKPPVRKAFAIVQLWKPSTPSLNHTGERGGACTGGWSDDLGHLNDQPLEHISSLLCLCIPGMHSWHPVVVKAPGELHLVPPGPALFCPTYGLSDRTVVISTTVALPTTVTTVLDAIRSLKMLLVPLMLGDVSLWCFETRPTCGHGKSCWVFANWYEEGTWSGESQGIKPDGSPLYVEGQTRFLVNDDLKITEMVVTRTFTSEWKKNNCKRRTARE